MIPTKEACAMYRMHDNFADISGEINQWLLKLRNKKRLFTTIFMEPLCVAVMIKFQDQCYVKDSLLHTSITDLFAAKC